MTDYIANTSATGTEPHYRLAAADTLTVAPSVLLAVTGGSSAVATEGGSMTISGSLASTGGYGVSFYFSNGGQGARALVTSTGTITARQRAFGNYDGGGIVNHPGGSLINAGSIFSSHSNAVGLSNGLSGSSAPLSVRNSGTLSGASYGVATGGGSTMSIWNSGLIEARNGDASAIWTSRNLSGGPTALVIENSGVLQSPGLVIDAATLKLTNSGLISAGTGESAISASASLNLLNLEGGRILGSVTGSAASDQVENSGSIYGVVNLGAGADVLDNTRGVVTGAIIGGAGADRVTGGEGRDLIYGDDLASADVSGGNDIVNGGGGDDLVFGGYGADTISGGYGDDVLNGGFGNDALYGNQGEDVLYGNQGDDWIHGGQGDDVVYGGQGNDTVSGGVGDDVLFGNLGDDSFVFSGQGFGHDVVADFSRSAGNMDTITFAPGIFASFADLQAHMVQMPTGVMIFDAAGDTVFIVGAATSGLTADMFAIG